MSMKTMLRTGAEPDRRMNIVISVKGYDEMIKALVSSVTSTNGFREPTLADSSRV